MNGDQTFNEILRAVGSLEGTQKELIKKIDTYEEKIGIALDFCQSFEDYKKNRTDLPYRISELEKVVHEYKNGAAQREADSKYLANLRTTFRALIIAAGLTNSVVLALIGIMTWMFHSGYLKVGI